MEDQDEGEDGYSDDDLDALPDHAFDELQENAVKSTQQPATHAQIPALKDQRKPQAIDLAVGFGQVSIGATGGQKLGQRALPPPSSDYGDFDDEMLDGEVLDGDALNTPPVFNASTAHDIFVADRLAGESTQRENWRQDRYGGFQTKPEAYIAPTGTQPATKVPSINDTTHHRLQDPPYAGHSSVSARHEATTPARPQQEDVEALQAQVQKVRFNPLSYNDCCLRILISYNENVKPYSRPSEMLTIMPIPRLAKSQ